MTLNFPAVTVFTATIMQLAYPPKFYITIVFNFSWVLQPSHEKSKTLDMKFFFLFSFFLSFLGGGWGGGEEKGALYFRRK